VTRRYKNWSKAYFLMYSSADLGSCRCQSLLELQTCFGFVEHVRTDFDSGAHVHVEFDFEDDFEELVGRTYSDHGPGRHSLVADVRICTYLL